MIVDYYQNLSQIEDELNENRIFTVPGIANKLQEKQEQILDRKLTVIEKAELQVVTDKLESL